MIDDVYGHEAGSTELNASVCISYVVCFVSERKMYIMEDMTLSSFFVANFRATCIYYVRVGNMVTS